MTYRKLHAAIEPEQSAVIPYRERDGRIEVLLVTTRKKGKWIVPKGWIEEDLAAHESAAKEAREEAGVRGRVSSVSLGCYQHGDGDGDPIVEVFLMRVERQEREWPEQEDRERRWVSLEDAYRHVEEEGLKSILDEASQLIGVGPAGGGESNEVGAHPAVPVPIGTEASSTEETGRK